jgi:hypothetical protein
MNKGIAAGLFVAGCFSAYAPGFNGLLRDAVHISAGEAQIITAIYFVGAAIVWFMPQTKDKP